jgi:hypothetical protein
VKKQTYFLAAMALLCLPDFVFSQTNMTSMQSYGNVKAWDMTSANALLGKVYTIEKNATCNIAFSPSQRETANATMVVTGTYTSDGMKVAGSAYKNCTQIGNQADRYFKPNAYLVFQNGTIQFSNQSACTSVQVYKLIDNSTILSDVVNSRVKTPVVWRFLVQKQWTKTYQNGSVENGTDLLIVDFNTPLTLTDACAYVKGLERNTTYSNFNFVSTITACLMDTGTFRPFLLKGSSVDGTFPTQQSNVIVIN